MANGRYGSTPSERFHAVMDELSRPEAIARVGAIMADPVSSTGRYEWLADADLFGSDWDWLTPDPDERELADDQQPAE